MHHLGRGRLDGRFSRALALAPWLPPMSGSQREMLAASFDHLVSAGDKGGREGDAYRLRRGGVEDELEPVALDHRQVLRMGSLQDAVNICGPLAIIVGQL